MRTTLRALRTFFALCLLLVLSAGDARRAFPSEETGRTPPKIGPKQGERFTNSLGMEFVYIGPGEFDMGSENGAENEKPVHRVVLDKGFFIACREVTQEQFEKLMGRNPSSFVGSLLPVQNTTWKDADEFCRILSLRDKAVYSLPTEAQWEYACRSGRGSEYSWGDTMNSEYCWYAGNSGGQTHEVGTKKANDFGLFDMSGNVYEICQDWYEDSYYRRSPPINPQGPGEGTERVLRGGSWSNREWYCRSASRVSLSPRTSLDRIGFRVVRLPD